jgi:molecular chaperone GrpE (heat shock protein)
MDMPEAREDQSSLLIEIRQAVDQLAERVTDGIRDDRFKEEQIRKMHAELQEYKRGLLDQALLPMLTQVVRLHENLNRQEQALRQKPPEELGPQRLFKELAGIREELEVILGESGVTIFEDPTGVFVPSRQTAREAVPTPDSELHGKISERLLPGYERDGRLISKECVRVFTHRPVAGSATPPSELAIRVAPGSNACAMELPIVTDLVAPQQGGPQP